ncbi:ORF155 [Saltwater crocodilepox virus]|nr:ORF155 [Saltwater crocodilepox virus]QGT47881.1 ORF155 [Saltwater crocodilepox virus]QGT48091.1 ORF155 [Saltwater crocodilepox virus]
MFVLDAFGLGVDAFVEVGVHQENGSVHRVDEADVHLQELRLDAVADEHVVLEVVLVLPGVGPRGLLEVGQQAREVAGVQPAADHQRAVLEPAVVGALEQADALEDAAVHADRIGDGAPEQRGQLDDAVLFRPDKKQRPEDLEREHVVVGAEEVVEVELVVGLDGRALGLVELAVGAHVQDDGVGVDGFPVRLDGFDAQRGVDALQVVLGRHEAVRVQAERFGGDAVEVVDLGQAQEVVRAVLEAGQVVLAEHEVQAGQGRVVGKRHAEPDP